MTGMLAEEISLGLRVRYPRTGTTGTVLRIEQIRGEMFAEIDTTHLMYRIDQLISATASKRTATTIVEDAKKDAKKVVEREREYAAGSELQEALKNIDQSCEGGG